MTEAPCPDFTAALAELRATAEKQGRTLDVDAALADLRCLAEPGPFDAELAADHAARVKVPAGKAALIAKLASDLARARDTLRRLMAPEADRVLEFMAESYAADPVVAADLDRRTAETAPDYFPRPVDMLVPELAGLDHELARWEAIATTAVEAHAPRPRTYSRLESVTLALAAIYERHTGRPAGISNDTNTGQKGSGPFYRFTREALQVIAPHELKRAAWPTTVDAVLRARRRADAELDGLA